MDIIDSLNQLSSRLHRLRETVQTEEATKNRAVGKRDCTELNT